MNYLGHMPTITDYEYPRPWWIVGYDAWNHDYWQTRMPVPVKPSARYRRCRPAR